MNPFSLNIRGRLISYNRPVVMAIVNATPDSFYVGSRNVSANEISERVKSAIDEGADIIDIGAYSSRPGADDVSSDEELRRLTVALKAVRSVDTDIPVSVDTFRASVASHCVKELGADIINDISGGELDPKMFETVAELRVPYILMHMRGNPSTMQSLTDYPSGVTAGVIAELAPKLERLSLLGVNDVIVDPGFGFAKTLEQNYQLLHDLRAFEMLGRPVLVGISRKSMLTRLLDITADEALNATTVLNTAALERGAAVLRVHDVRAAREAVEIITCLNKA
ncbi:MAG: dihydropteroate synthase [Muribaculaceae bacterium]|nr:dihydropteroate synthase [Muribaculaceae bacterium]